MENGQLECLRTEVLSGPSVPRKNVLVPKFSSTFSVLRASVYEASRIIVAAEEPYKTMFALAATTGLRAGELLALTVPDLDFHRKTIRVSKSADDNTRMIREPKTKKSVALLPMASNLAAMLRYYLQHHWKHNEKQFLFPNRKGTHPRWRDNVVKYGLKPVLRKLNLPERNAGLHAFRHGLATELAETEPITVLQT